MEPTRECAMLDHFTIQAILCCNIFTKSCKSYMVKLAGMVLVCDSEGGGGDLVFHICK